MSATDGPTDVEMKFHCIPHPREYIHRHCRDSRCNTSAYIWKTMDPFVVNDVLDIPQKTTSVGARSGLRGGRLTGLPMPNPSTTKLFVQSSAYNGTKMGWCTILLENEAVNFSSTFWCHCMHRSGRTISCSMDIQGRAN
jgi:hypothetical protein